VRRDWSRIELFDLFLNWTTYLLDRNSSMLNLFLDCMDKIKNEHLLTKYSQVLKIIIFILYLTIFYANNI